MERPTNVKDKSVLAYIHYLEDQLKTPYAEAYISLKNVIDKGNEQLKNFDMDIFTLEGEAKFKQALKFSSQLKDWFEQLEYFKSKMNPDEVKKEKEERELTPVERQKKIANADTPKI
jgi:hypothetical protein